MKWLLAALLLFSLQAAFAQQRTVGIFDNHADIGKPANTGDAVYDPRIADLPTQWQRV